jgi:septation ring formation regulator EzrA
MNLDELTQRLQAMSQGSDAEFANAANFVLQVIDQAQSGQMSPSETAETLQDIQRQMTVIDAEHQLAVKEELNTIINGLIKIAGAV